MVQQSPVQVSECQAPGCGAPATKVVATGPSAGMYVCASHIPRRVDAAIFGTLIAQGLQG